MRSWLILLGGMIVWAIHFFTVWAVGSVVLAVPPARVIVGALTVLGIAANVGLLVLIARTEVRDDLEKWTRSLGQLGVALSLLAVTWQGLPALLTR